MSAATAHSAYEAGLARGEQMPPLTDEQVQQIVVLLRKRPTKKSA